MSALSRWQSGSSAAPFSVRAVALALTSAAALGGLAALLYARCTTRSDAPHAPVDGAKAHFARCRAIAARKAARKLFNNNPTNDTAARSTPALSFRRPTADDVQHLAEQWTESYNSSAKALGGTAVFPTAAAALSMVTEYVSNKVGLVAVDSHGIVLASAFHDESDIAESGIVGAGPYTVAWAETNRGVGGALFVELISQSLSRGAKSLRLLAGPTNTASTALYQSLGFDVREPLTCWSGVLRQEVVNETMALNPRWVVQQWSETDVDAVDALWRKTTGQEGSRRATLLAAARANKRAPRLLVRNSAGGEVIAFTTGFQSIGSAAASSVAAFQHLVCAAVRMHTAPSAAASSAAFPAAAPSAAPSPVFHTCSRLHPGLARWLLAGGMQVARVSYLMVLGDWTPLPESGSERFVVCPSTELS